MKNPSRYVWMFWLGNAALLIGVAMFLWSAKNNASSDQASQFAKVRQYQTAEDRTEWKSDDERAPLETTGERLSPLERPRPPVAPTPKVETPPPVPKTDAELKRELERALRDRFKLMRLMLCNSPDYPNVAMLVAGSVRMQWFKDMNLKSEYANAQSSELRKLALDINVLRIDEQGVLLDAPSFEKPEKRFEVLLSIETETSSLVVSADFFPQGGALKLEGTGQPSPQRFEHNDAEQKAEQWGYPLPEDYNEKAIEDFAKYTRATDGGLEILPELPEDSPARKYGARGGEIIKRINGEGVKTMSDVRRIVRTKYDAGIREFIVEFERDGLPGERGIIVK
ncbi:MAG: hypothetical protein R3E76_07530 [Planctomycetota bacterium]